MYKPCITKFEQLNLGKLRAGMQLNFRYLMWYSFSEHFNQKLTSSSEFIYQEKSKEFIFRMHFFLSKIPFSFLLLVADFFKQKALYHTFEVRVQLYEQLLYRCSVLNSIYFYFLFLPMYNTYRLFAERISKTLSAFRLPQ